MDDIEVLANAIDLEGRTVVDVGCGDGTFVRALREAGADAIGVDIDIKDAHWLDPEGRYLKGGAERLPLRDQSVDVATLMRSLHHVPDPRDAFPELARVVREYVYIAEPLPEGEFFELLRPVDDETEVRAKAQAAIRTSGFEHVDTIEYEVTVRLDRLEELRERVLAADPTRGDSWAAVEHQLAGRFKPGDFPVPMRADILRPPAR
ncbi:class I SAM-dependent methyltransferase [Solirubrobacter sp. CPCC 204708]|uniref:Class I SAM-dependent methyltransferase n=1 Tax=Solirubrobacter deserti TaxID=2282478 RepID=A0ABT4RD60_9ACTN|nr:class I SAM-dependent methyltransferase [Solirubrobacter deserti]MBE2317766.1 class I SAM-dependent methyltransferase [Solirubrobacter deserti]MDA0136457.1 class I SAM-dependent methyltransferase [Solirubrobacter deserti]